MIRYKRVSALLAVIGLAATGIAIASPASALVTVTVEAAGATASTVTGYNLAVNTLNAVPNGMQSITFGNSGITSTTGDFVNIYDANVYGGAGGTGKYGSVTGDATLQLSRSVNYFGLWGSALDGRNTVALYSDATLLGTYALQEILEASPKFSSGYKGNPFVSGNSGEEYAFFNFMSDVAFNRVKLIQNSGGGFEFDNLTVGTVSAAPEPATWAMLLVGFGAIGWMSRKARPAPQMRFGL